jgi:hypothetical protein
MGTGLHRFGQHAFDPDRIVAIQWELTYFRVTLRLDDGGVKHLDIHDAESIAVLRKYLAKAPDALSPPPPGGAM